MVCISAPQIVEVMQSWPDSRRLDLMSISVGVKARGPLFWCRGTYLYSVFLQRLPEIPLYLVRKFILAPQLEKTHKTPPSLRAEGLLFLHGLESNPGSSLQTEEEAGLP